MLSRSQLRKHGISDHAILAHRRAGRWATVHPCVYALHTAPIGSAARIWAALLYAGEGAVASHITAAELWGLADVDGYRDVHVLVPGERRVCSRAGIVVRRCDDLLAGRHPVLQSPRTLVEETVLDLVGTTADYREVVHWVTVSCQRRRTTPAHLRQAMAARTRQRWRPELAALLADVSDGVQTPLELAYLRDVERAHGLPRADRQRHHLVGARSQWIDVKYERFRVIAELDGRLGHEPFRDNRRDNASTVLGYDTLRYGWVAVTRTPCVVAAEVGDVLYGRGWRGLLRSCGPTCTALAAA